MSNPFSRAQRKRRNLMKRIDSVDSVRTGHRIMSPPSLFDMHESLSDRELRRYHRSVRSIGLDESAVSRRLKD